MIGEIKNIKSGKDELRKFGLTVGIVLAFLGLLFLWREKGCCLYLIITSALLLFFGIAAPIVLKPFHKIWMSIAIIIGFFVTRIILCILYYLAVAPIGLISRLFGKDFLNTKFKKGDADSYWLLREAVQFDRSRYQQQF